MKRIGYGWQVQVYEYNQDTVYKKPQSLIRSVLVMIKDFPMVIFMPSTLKRLLREVRTIHHESLLKVSKRSDLSDLIGNPIIESSGAYYQQKVIPIHFYIKGLSVKDFKTLVNKFVDFTFDLYQQGIIDKSFNFLKNFGVDNNGKFVLIDLGELYFDKQQIEDQIQRRPWARPQFLILLSKEKREYFLKMMDGRFVD